MRVKSRKVNGRVPHILLEKVCSCIPRAAARSRCVTRFCRSKHRAFAVTLTFLAKLTVKYYSPMCMFGNSRRVAKLNKHPRPCPDAHIYAAMCAANDVERLMLRLGAEAGLRLSEIAAVHSRDVLEGDAGPSLIVRGKGDKQRIVPISEDLAKRITAAPGWLFPAGGGDTSKNRMCPATSHGCCRTVGGRTRCATGTPRACTRPRTICCWSRNCWDIAAWRPRKSTWRCRTAVCASAWTR